MSEELNTAQMISIRSLYYIYEIIGELDLHEILSTITENSEYTSYINNINFINNPNAERIFAFYKTLLLYYKCVNLRRYIKLIMYNYIKVQIEYFNNNYPNISINVMHKSKANIIYMKLNDHCEFRINLTVNRNYFIICNIKVHMTSDVLNNKHNSLKTYISKFNKNEYLYNNNIYDILENMCNLYWKLLEI